jgi:hypothetical protein
MKPNPREFILESSDRMDETARKSFFLINF